MLDWEAPTGGYLLQAWPCQPAQRLGAGRWKWLAWGRLEIFLKRKTTPCKEHGPALS
jgi:hypothetical protein